MTNPAFELFTTFNYKLHHESDTLLYIKHFRFTSLSYDFVDSRDQLKINLQSLPSRTTGHTKCSRREKHKRHDYNIRSDCISAIEALSKPLNFDKTIDAIQQIAKESNNIFKISWVKAHVGTQGKEDLGALPKHAALNPH